MGAAIVCALLGLLFLVLSLPLGKLLNRAPKLPLFHFGWPRSSSEWSVRLVAAAIIFFAIAAAAFYWGTDPAAKPAFIRWLDSLFQ
jgi:hypothetical protein